MTIEERARLAYEIYDRTLDHTDGFYEPDCVGGDLVYLLAAILEPSGEGFVDWTDEWLDDGQSAEEKWPLLPILRKAFAADHLVWNFIKK